MKNLLIKSFFSSIDTSVENLRGRISDVAMAPLQGKIMEITFTLDGQKYIGQLKGRNSNCLVGFGENADKGIACRVWLDGDAQKVV